MTSTTTMASTTALTAADAGFALLIARPAPLLFDGRDIAGMPDRMLALDELRDLLLRGRVDTDVSDAVWRQLARQVREWGREWVTAACGIAAPGLTRMAAKLTRGRRDQSSDDVAAELVTGFLHAVHTIELEPPRVWLRLCWAAWRAGLTALHRDHADELPPDLPTGSRTPSLPYGHPDVLLARAAAAGLITVEQAELIGATRLGGTLIDVLAAQAGVSGPVMRMRRRRAELILARAISRGDLADIAARRPQPTREPAPASRPWTVLAGVGEPVRPVRTARRLSGFAADLAPI